MIRRLFTFRLIHDARTAAEVAHARPAYAAGMRAAIAVLAPLLLGAHLPAGGASWSSLSALNGAIGDRGGPYRTRAALMGALALASAVAAFIGCVLSLHPVLAVIATFILAMLCGLARAWSEVGPGFGVATLVTFAISLAVPSSSISAAFARAGYIAAGGLWAMLLAIVLWPIRPYRPVRLRITECYRAIARYVEAAADDVTEGAAHDPWALKSHLVAVRTAIESARTSLAVSRRGRATESWRGERLLVLHEYADQIYVHMIALLEDSDAAGGELADAIHRRLPTLLAEIAGAARGIANAVESERDLPRVRITFNGSALRDVDEGIAEILDRIADYETMAAQIAGSLNSGGPASVISTDSISIPEPPPEPALFSMSAVVRPSSVVLHHALRVAIVTSLAVIITNAFRLNHGYWVTLTAVVILQPYAASTRQKALQRVIGTIVGGIVAAGLSALFQGGVAVLVLVAIFTMLCVALLPLNYGAYAVFGTPAFVLLAEASAGDWHLAGLRIINTIIGGGLALLGAQLLWRGDERNQLPDLAATTLRASDELLHRVLRLVGGLDPVDLGSLRDARREVAFAAANAEDSFQRLMSEHAGSPESLEPVMTLLIYVRRIAASAAALAAASSADTRPSAEELQPFERAAHGVLADLADAIASGRAPTPFPPVGAIATPLASTAPVAALRLTRIARQLRLLHSAVVRWISPTAEQRVRVRR